MQVDRHLATTAGAARRADSEVLAEQEDEELALQAVRPGGRMFGELRRMTESRAWASLTSPAMYMNTCLKLGDPFSRLETCIRRSQRSCIGQGRSDPHIV